MSNAHKSRASARWCLPIEWKMMCAQKIEIWRFEFALCKRQEGACVIVIVNEFPIQWSHIQLIHVALQHWWGGCTIELFRYNNKLRHCCNSDFKIIHKKQTTMTIFTCVQNYACKKDSVIQIKRTHSELNKRIKDFLFRYVQVRYVISYMYYI